MRKILFSLVAIAAAAAIVATGTSALFSDTETSTGNTFTAGAIDLTIDNTSYYNGVYNQGTSWEAKDLDGELFFNFSDLKPGDLGEDTISLHVNNNPAYACVDIAITSNDDVDCTEPELDDDPTCSELNQDLLDGELAQNLNFMFWADDGDNVLEDDEQVITQGPASDVLNGVTYALADSAGNIFTGQAGPIDGSETYYIGKAWCFGELSEDRVSQDDLGFEGAEEANGPDVRGAGVDCDGLLVDNASQTDELTGDIRFRAVQARNNDDFVCQPLGDDFGQPPVDDREPVGAALSAYVAPDCTTTISSDIQGAVDGATSGDVICVEDGTYTETVVIDKPLTLASVNGPTNTATITGGIQIDSSDVTVTGFIINPGDVPADPGNIGVFINGSYDNITISYNDIDGTGVANDRGILTTTGSSYSNILVTHNLLHDLVTGMYINPHTGNIDVTYNDIYDNTAGIGGFTGATVSYNEFDHSVAASEAIGADSTYDGASAISFNNFLNGVMINDYNAGGTLISAENNHFNLGGATQTTVGEVDYTPEEVSAFPHN